MPRADGRDGSGWAPDPAGVPDTRLAELLGAAPARAYPALRELRVRHEASVLAYARLCATDEPAARRLAAQAFSRAAREAARGSDPGLPWRHQLLLLVGRLAEEWSRDERAAALNPDLRRAVPAAVPPLLPAFRSLPSRAQGLLWYGVVEREPDARTASLLGLTDEDVTYGTGPALRALSRASLRLRLAASDDPRCADFQRLIEESVRPDNPRHSPDLTAHTRTCAHCAGAVEEQHTLRDTPRGALAEGLLPWAGTTYAGELGRATDGASAAGPSGSPYGGGGHGVSGAGAGAGGMLAIGSGAAYGTGDGGSGAATAYGTGAGTAHGGGDREPDAGSDSGGWPPARRLVFVSVAFGVALVPLLVVLLAPGGGSDQRAVGAAVSVPPSVPVVTVTATVSVTPSASASPSPSPTSASPTPSRRTPSPHTASPRPAPKPTPRPAPAPTRPPGGSYAQVVNVGTGLCLDVAGYFDNGTDVIGAPCSSSPTQRWRYDAGLGVLQSSADPDYCLDSRGSVDRGVGVWTCSSVYGRNGANLTFMIDSDGAIRPAIAIETALTDEGYGDLWLDPLDGSRAQRWRAGAA